MIFTETTIPTIVKKLSEALGKRQLKNYSSNTYLPQALRHNNIPYSNTHENKSDKRKEHRNAKGSDDNKSLELRNSKEENEKEHEVEKKSKSGKKHKRNRNKNKESKAVTYESTSEENVNNAPA